LQNLREQHFLQIDDRRRVACVLARRNAPCIDDTMNVATCSQFVSARNACAATAASRQYRTDLSNSVKIAFRHARMVSLSLPLESAAKLPGRQSLHASFRLRGIRS